MASPKTQPHYYYSPLPPSESDQPQQQNYVVLPLYFPPGLGRRSRCRIILAATLLALAFVVYFLWPSDPDVKIVRLHLDRIQFHTRPRISIDVSLALTVKVKNTDLYSMDYRSLGVSIAYRGKQLGSVTSDQGHVIARGSSYVNATLQLDGVEVLLDVILLLQDLAKGSIPLDTVTEVRGQFGFFFFRVPLKAKVSCEVYVNTINQTIMRQNCYPE